MSVLNVGCLHLAVAQITALGNVMTNLNAGHSSLHGCFMSRDPNVTALILPLIARKCPIMLSK